MKQGPECAIGVTELTQAIKRLIENGFPAVWVRGEISNLRRQPSGHCYFSLKDERSQLSAVLFRGNALRAECEPENGRQVLALGELSVYEPRGTYQMIVRELIEDGIGRLQREFEKLKERMRQEGLFDEARKKSLPWMPLRVGVITSASGAAIRDMISVFRRMGWPGSLRIFPSLVQGPTAAPSLVRQLERAGRMQDLDLLVLARGGGSLEDLWCFNDESVARALSECPIPTISAIGHETDVVLTDFVADLRKETPTGAAEWISTVVARVIRDFEAAGEDLFVVGREALRNRLGELERVRARTQARPFLRQIEVNLQRIDEWQSQIVRIIEQNFAQKFAAVDQLKGRLKLRSPDRMLVLRKNEMDQVQKRFRAVTDRRIGEKKERLEHLLRALRAGGLDQTLRRGFALVRDGDGKPLRRAADCRVDDRLSIEFHDGKVGARAEDIDFSSDGAKGN